MPSGPKPAVSLEQLVAVFEELYARSGFVKWTEVAERTGQSRANVSKRINDAVARGDLSSETVERWRSLTARRHQSSQNRTEHAKRSPYRVDVTLTPENYEFIKDTCTKYNANMGEALNARLEAMRKFMENPRMFTG